jgi:folate-binding protein YgfZ
MPRTSPLLSAHDAAGAVLAPYGPEGDGIPVVQVYSGIDREYAAIRKSAAIFDLPQRAVLAVSGADRLSFLNRMVTQELKGLLGDAKPPFALRRSFWLNRKGRIDADLTVIAQPNEILLEVDTHAAQRTLEGLSSFIIADDVKVEDRSVQLHRLDLHGPAAAAILGHVAEPVEGSPALTDLLPGNAAAYQIERDRSLIWRLDLTGEPGFALAISERSAARAYELLAETAESIDRNRTRPDRGFDLKERAAAALDARAIRAGWHAFNIARIEAGTALYNIDFGSSSLPHEAGPETLNDRVSFKKGCYLGQEVVARMNALGHPKQRLVAFDLVEPASDSAANQPVTGSLIFAGPDTELPPIGAITSSAISPMLGGRIACFGMVKYAHTTPGTDVHVQPAPGVAMILAKVRESLRYWSRPITATG